MNDETTAQVTVGLPVYNGESYLRESLDSLLDQTFTDFEIFIVDNASTDATPSIAREYARRDSRVHYRRNAENIGGFRNHRLAFSFASGPYFMWAADDDVREREYLERCVELLEKDPGAVGSYSRMYITDDRGDVVSEGQEDVLGDEEWPADRFATVIRLEHRVEPLMGLFRTEALREIRLPGEYPDSDRVMLAELSLLGRFVRAPEYLFYRRDHEMRSARKYPSRQERMEWITPGQDGGLMFPHWRQLYELQRAIHRSPVDRKERRACYGHLLRWARTYRRRLYADMKAVRWLVGSKVKALGGELDVLR